MTVEEIEQSPNVTYTENNGKINVKMSEGTYGYLVLCVKSTDCDVLSVVKDSVSGEVTAKIRNNTHDKKTVEVLTASYSGSRLSAVVKEKIELKDVQTYNYTTKLDAEKMGDKVKVFVWDEASSMKPNAAQNSK